MQATNEFAAAMHQHTLKS